MAVCRSREIFGGKTSLTESAAITSFNTFVAPGAQDEPRKWKKTGDHTFRKIEE